MVQPTVSIRIPAFYTLLMHRVLQTLETRAVAPEDLKSSSSSPALEIYTLSPMLSSPENNPMEKHDLCNVSLHLHSLTSPADTADVCLTVQEDIFSNLAHTSTNQNFTAGPEIGSPICNTSSTNRQSFSYLQSVGSTLEKLIENAVLILTFRHMTPSMIILHYIRQALHHQTLHPIYAVNEPTVTLHYLRQALSTFRL
jgi:hypothetical protein